VLDGITGRGITMTRTENKTRFGTDQACLRVGLRDDQGRCGASEGAVLMVRTKETGSEKNGTKVFFSDFYFVCSFLPLRLQEQRRRSSAQEQADEDRRCAHTCHSPVRGLS